MNWTHRGAKHFSYLIFPSSFIRNLIFFPVIISVDCHKEAIWLIRTNHRWNNHTGSSFLSNHVLDFSSSFTRSLSFFPVLISLDCHKEAITLIRTNNRLNNHTGSSFFSNHVSFIAESSHKCYHFQALLLVSPAFLPILAALWRAKGSKWRFHKTHY